MSGRQFHLIYILPNLFTAASIFTAIVAIVSSINGNFEKSAWLIFLSIVFDGLDGRIARLTRTTSRFGAEFDSLADIIAFGVAPALLLYLYIGQEYGKLGVLVMALYIIFGAIRLARFNTMSLNADPAVFIGVPIPVAAIFVSVWVLMFGEYGALQEYSVSLLIATLLVSLLMVSNIRYPSFKKINLKKPVLTKTLILLIISASLIYLYPVEGFASISTLYLIWGIAGALRTIINRKMIHSGR